MENIAYKSFNAFSGIVIHGFEYGIDSKVIFSYQFDEKTVGKIHKCKIYSNENGQDYFLFCGRREYLRDYLRF